MNFIISRSVKITRKIMLLLHWWNKIKDSGLNKVYISLASLGEIKNLFVPCSFRAVNNFFILFHRCNNTPMNLSMFNVPILFRWKWTKPVLWNQKIQFILSERIWQKLLWWLTSNPIKIRQEANAKLPTEIQKPIFFSNLDFATKPRKNIVQLISTSNTNKNWSYILTKVVNYQK